MSTPQECHEWRRQLDLPNLTDEEITELVAYLRRIIGQFLDDYFRDNDPTAPL